MKHEANSKLAGRRTTAALPTGGAEPSRWRHWGRRLGIGVFVLYTVKGVVWLVLGAFILLAGNCGNQ